MSEKGDLMIPSRESFKKTKDNSEGQKSKDVEIGGFKSHSDVDRERMPGIDVVDDKKEVEIPMKKVLNEDGEEVQKVDIDDIVTELKNDDSGQEGKVIEVDFNKGK